MRKNADLARIVREAVGPDVDIMFDAWMGWDEAYAVRMMDRIAEYDVRWVEEPVPADRINDFAAIRKATRVPLATGEHEYTRWGFLQLLQAEAVDVIQADPDWAGGLTEMAKICALASAYGKPVCPHGHSVRPAIHLIAAQSPTVCPLAEFLVKYQPGAQFFLKGFVEPVNGAFALPTEPGLGIALDEARIDRVVEVE
jgi:L-alanine-DL-glutamate epimerase-like enolase superfamily enzyme